MLSHATSPMHSVDDNAAELAPEPMSGIDWLEQAKGNAGRTLPTGCAGGKTKQLYATCATMLAAVDEQQQQQRPSGSAVWLDATPGFSAMRVQRHLLARLGQDSPDANVLFDRVQRVQCVLPEECVKALALIEDRLETVTRDPFWSFLHLIVLDSVHALFTALVGDAREPWECMANQVITLKRTATDYGIVVMVINHATRSKRKAKPVLGHSGEFLVDERITIDFVPPVTTLYNGLIAELSADQKDALVSLFTMNDRDEGEADTLPREATFHAKFSAPAGVPLDVAAFVKAVLEHCGGDETDEKGASASRDAPDMAGILRGGMPGMWGCGGMRGRGWFRGMWGGRGGMAGMKDRGGMGSGGMGSGGMPGFGPHGFPGHQDPFGAHGPHQGPFSAHGPRSPHGGPRGMPFGPGAPWGGAHRRPGQWQYQGKSRHGAIALTMDIREI
ncbi:hypothetical protein AMAG_03186 [Allomyces macrogynus ATCC 38327]|uniref:RecA family profile 1 domain-containing protein n=1 Tax=Allomyces macrogynus (strain ATCC 38327) TaxID=578462 RepID=A0A0L0S4V5_ALLM3|nr:hypothetical protein AMAG_03186 [Allomyces macrogynus ATCC 38327]|eukprot:KNE57475.1 hypothetical protein AMAG_03186 [Allomyces macrogynus ATCC 38327]